ncbi:MAG: PA14 domain-containing protein [Candidatus Brocadia sp.]|nr:PA14 domain-containing protein [Candidatus Brocadia sp.]
MNVDLEELEKYLKEEKYTDVIEGCNKRLLYALSHKESVYLWCLKGVAFDKLERYHDAVICFNHALNLYPKEKNIWVYKGLSLTRIGRFSEAIDCFNKALALDPNNEDIKKKKENAEETLKKENELPLKLEISETNFAFSDLRIGFPITQSFTISNMGGRALSGSIKTDKKWLRVFQSDIDPTQQKQDVIFQVNTSGLAFGFKDTGTIEIRSNAGTERVNVTISVEAVPVASYRAGTNIPVIAGLGVLGLAIIVAVVYWLMALKGENEAKLYTTKTKQERQDRQTKYAEHPVTQQKTSAPVQSTLPQKETSEAAHQNCFASVPPDRWKGEYYNNKDLSGNPSMVRDDGDGFINADWGNTGPGRDCGIGADDFSVRWTRNAYFNSGIYRFSVASDDGFRLYIDDVLKLGEWYDQEATTYTIDVPLTAGNHSIKLEYYENKGGAFAKLFWQVVSTPEQLKVQSPVAINISGEWEGKVDTKLAKLLITQNGNSLSGNIEYDNVKEYLSGESNNDQIVLKGTRYEAKRGKKFSLDTFSGTISSRDGDFIRGNYRDEDGHIGTWFVTKLKSSPQEAAQKSISSYDILSDDEVRAFIEKIVNLGKENGKIEEIMQCYADNVDYYDKGSVNKDFIKQHILSIHKTWPYREYRIISTIMVIPGNTDNEKTAKFIQHSITRNDQKTLEGKSTVEVTLRKQGNCILIIRKKSPPDTQQTTDNYKPQTAIQEPQAILTKAMQKNPGVLIKLNGIYRTIDNAKVNFLNNNSLKIYFEKDRVIIDCTWSSSDLTYVGTWRYEDRRKREQGKIKLWPRYNSDGEIKCFSGYIRKGNDYPGDPIKIETLWCLCPDPD